MRRMFRFKAVIAGAVLVALCSPRLGSAGVISSSTDEIFVTNAAHSGFIEVASGKLAAANGASASVRTIGQQMIVDHAKMNAKLTSIARADSVVVPATPDAAGRSILAQQKRLSGNAFDAAYLNGQVEAHQKAIDLFKTEIAQGSNPQLVAFAKQFLPIIESHLNMIQTALESL